MFILLNRKEESVGFFLIICLGHKSTTLLGLPGLKSKQAHLHAPLDTHSLPKAPHSVCKLLSPREEKLLLLLGIRLLHVFNHTT